MRNSTDAPTPVQGHQFFSPNDLLNLGKSLASATNITVKYFKQGAANLKENENDDSNWSIIVGYLREMWKIWRLEVSLIKTNKNGSNLDFTYLWNLGIFYFN